MEKPASDLIPVLVHAGNRPVTVWHTPDEYEALTGSRKPVTALAAENFPEGDYPKGDH